MVFIAEVGPRAEDRAAFQLGEMAVGQALHTWTTFLNVRRRFFAIDDVGSKFVVVGFVFAPIAASGIGEKHERKTHEKGSRVHQKRAASSRLAFKSGAPKSQLASGCAKISSA